MAGDWLERCEAVRSRNVLMELITLESVPTMVVAANLRWCAAEVLMERTKLRWSAREVAFGSWTLLAGTALIN